MAKITQLQVWIIGVVLALISGVLIFFLLIKPSNEAKDAATARYDAAHAVAVTENEKKKDLEKAKQEVAKANREWRRYDAALMPDINISNLINGMFELWNEQLHVLGPLVDKYLRKDKSVELVQANIQLPPPPTDPNAVNRKVFVYELGTVTVMGKFEDILKHVDRWNKFNRLVLADGLTLQGNSPRLMGTYTLRAFIFTHGTDTPGTAIPQATTTGAGGMGGGMGAGMARPGMSGDPGMEGGSAMPGAPPAGGAGGAGSRPPDDM